MAVENGDTVSVWYLGTLEDGSVFDTNILEEAKKAGTYQSTRPYEPLTFQVGAGQMIKGFDLGVVGMKEGDTKTVRISAKDAYGEKRAERVIQVPVIDLKDAGVDPSVGAKVAASNGASGTITEINGTNATIDFNHFLAGKALIFKITMQKIVKAK